MIIDGIEIGYEVGDYVIRSPEYQTEWTWKSFCKKVGMPTSHFFKVVKLHNRSVVISYKGFTTGLAARKFQKENILSRRIYTIEECL